jgi:hypothetical protein
LQDKGIRYTLGGDNEIQIELTKLKVRGLNISGSEKRFDEESLWRRHYMSSLALKSIFIFTLELKEPTAL